MYHILFCPSQVIRLLNFNLKHQYHLSPVSTQKQRHWPQNYGRISLSEIQNRTVVVEDDSSSELYEQQWGQGFTKQDWDTLENNEWLTNHVVDEGQSLLKRQYPHLMGFRVWFWILPFHLLSKQRSSFKFSTLNMATV